LKGKKDMNIKLNLLTKEDSLELFLFEKINKEYFEKMVPPRPDSYFEFDGFKLIMDELLEEQDLKKSVFYLIKNESGDIVGRMNLVDINWKLKSGEVGYRVGEKFTGNGAAVKALQLMTAEAQRFGLSELKARTTVDNIPSQKVLGKNGFNKILVDDEKKFLYYRLGLTKEEISL
jgi:[ribosomal protein S5]-alanine N-acetyltransferase